MIVKPTVSICLPVYNGQKYLKDAIDSILAQSYRDFELIISDNCSTDKTQDICREFASRDKRVRYFRQTENIGIFPNVEYLIGKAEGIYFMLIGDDDIYDKNFISLLIPLFDKDDNIGIVYSDYGFISDTGLIKNSQLKIFMKYTDTPFQNMLSFTKATIVLPMMMGLYKTYLLKKNIPFPKFGEMTGGVDVAFLYKIIPNIQVDSFSKPLFWYREKDRSNATPEKWKKNRVYTLMRVMHLNQKIFFFFYVPSLLKTSKISFFQKGILLFYASGILIYNTWKLFNYYCIDPIKKRF